MTIYDSFAVVDVPFPFVDSPRQKNRPALVISSPAFQVAGGAVVLVILTHVDNRGNFRTVVAGEYHQCIVGHSETIERLQQVADDVVHLEDEITVRPGLSSTLELIGGE